MSVQNKTYYRLVDPNYEPINTMIDTDVAEMPPRMKKVIELMPIFNILLSFWQESGLQLDTVCNGFINLSLYLDEVKRIEASGETIVPTSIINTKETKEHISLTTLKKLIFPYCDMYENTRMVLKQEDLPSVWEYLWFVVRKSFYPDKLDRFKSIFLFDELHHVKDFQQTVDPLQDRIICKAELMGTRAIEHHDMKWLNDIPVQCSFDQMIQVASNYWEGKSTTSPIIEYLFSGVYKLNPI
jgi:hypothetical protein